ncbi:MAG: RNA 3'-terminal phosphate cyclase [Halanaeroarchaeum sp.]
MLELEGSEGGGQLLRTAVSIGALTGTPIEMTNVRGDRDEPGLKPQHVSAIDVLASITDAVTSGVEPTSTEFAFDPGDVEGGEYEVDIGTAGSCTLVFDALLPLAAALESELSVTVRGGTDVEWAPPFDYFRSVKLPALRTLGLESHCRLRRRGFYPSGGGEATLTIEPSSLSAVRFVHRGSLQSVTVHSIASESLESANVAERQSATAVTRLEETVQAPIDRVTRYVEASDTGSVVVLAATYENSFAGFSALGERGKPSEAVARSATERFDTFRRSHAAVDDHLADQLIPFLALEGGRLRIRRRTTHVRSVADLLAAMGYAVTIEDEDDGIIVSAPESHSAGRPQR